MAEEQLNPGTLTAVRKVRGTRAQAITYIRNGEAGDLPTNRTMPGRFVKVFNGWQSVMCDDGELTVGQVEAASWAPVKPVFPEQRETQQRREWRVWEAIESALFALGEADIAAGLGYIGGVLDESGEMRRSVARAAMGACVAGLLVKEAEGGESRRSLNDSAILAFGVLGERALAVLADLVKHRSGKGIAGGEAHEQRWQELWWMAEAIVKLRERCTEKAEGGAP